MTLELRLKEAFERVAQVSKNNTVKLWDLSTLTTVEKTNLVSALNEVYSSVDTKITTAVTNLINWADSASDTLKELADKITALVQADNWLVSAVEAQSFTETQKTTARNNIWAAAQTNLTTLSDNVWNTDHNFVTDFDNIYNS